MPLLICDYRGTRIGMGGGYYDRTLAHWQAQGWALPTLIGVAHKEGQVDFAPDAHDIAMNLICAVCDKSVQF